MIKRMQKLIEQYRYFIAYMKYKNVASCYTTPKSYEEWYYDVTNLRFTC